MMKPRPLPSLEQLMVLFSYDPATGKFTRLTTTGSRARKGNIAGSLARRAYDEAALRLHGEYATTNTTLHKAV
jgi:hypothetical protein